MHQYVKLPLCSHKRDIYHFFAAASYNSWGNVPSTVAKRCKIDSKDCCSLRSDEWWIDKHFYFPLRIEGRRRILILNDGDGDVPICNTHCQKCCLISLDFWGFDFNWQDSQNGFLILVFFYHSEEVVVLVWRRLSAALNSDIMILTNVRPLANVL